MARERSIKLILRALSSKERSIWELISYQDAHLSEYFELIQHLMRRGYLEMSSGKLKLTQLGIESAQRLRFVEYACPRCSSKGMQIDGLFNPEIQALFNQICSEKPMAKPEYDQGSMDPLDVLAKSCFIHARGDLEDSRILILGDDDLLGIGLGLTGLARRILVLDIDRELIDYISRRSSQLGLDVETMIYNALDPLPRDLRRRFDVFITDTVETYPGLRLFLSRGAHALRGRGAAIYLGLTHLESSLRKWYRIQHLLHRMGFCITDVLRDFGKYPYRNWSHLYPRMRISEMASKIHPEITQVDFDFYRSSLIRAQAITNPKPSIRGRSRLGKKLYLDSESVVTPE